eukprot:Amastigsp_a3627_17.p4 type:complete len:156 gc:universal Amastigsp_a3627_17:614-147(-)
MSAQGDRWPPCLRTRTLWSRSRSPATAPFCSPARSTGSAASGTSPRVSASRRSCTTTTRPWATRGSLRTENTSSRTTSTSTWGSGTTRNRASSNRIPRLARRRQRRPRATAAPRRSRSPHRPKSSAQQKQAQSSFGISTRASSRSASTLRTQARS